MGEWRQHVQALEIADYVRSVHRECGRVMRAVRDVRGSAGVDGGSFCSWRLVYGRAMLMNKWPRKIVIKGET